MIHALVLAAAVERCDTGTTYDMRACWSRKDSAARDAMRDARRRVAAEMQRLGLATRTLSEIDAAWSTMREATCEFEYRHYLPGTIAPQLGTECDVRMTQARTRRLEGFLTVLQAHGTVSNPVPVSPQADRELNRVYRLYRAALGGEQRAAFASAELDWIAYRDKACALEGGACMTELTKDRVAELEASWIGEPFW
jgi:uncharacterized protein YecT (DUF1311 family)